MRIAVNVGVAYGSDTRLVEKLLLEAAGNVDKVRTYPPAQVLFRDFGDSSLDFQLRGFITADDVVITPSELRHQITTIFEREGITIPFPQRDLNFEWPRRFDEEGAVAVPDETRAPEGGEPEPEPEAD